MKPIYASNFLLLLLSFSVYSSSTTEQVNTQVLKDADYNGNVFSFTKKIVNHEKTNDWDLVFDLPHGLGTNNKALVKSWRNGGLISKGGCKLSQLKNAPKSGYLPSYKPDALSVGSCFYVRLADGKRYAKIRITLVDTVKKIITFEWVLFK